MNIEIWSDIICPFCYIGKRRLEQALNISAITDYKIIWRSYQLDPSAPKYSDYDVYDYLAQRKGLTRQQSMSMHENVVRMAASVGLDYHFELAKVANSGDALRLVKLADTIHKSNEAKEALFEAYFVHGRHISDHKTLTEIGESIGLNFGTIRECLESDMFADKVQADIDEARSIGVTGVPFFLFDRKLAVSGAQPLEVFQQAIAQAQG